MFRARQRLPFCQHFPAILPTIQVHENGKCETYYKDEAEGALPDADTTKLSTLIAAGVDLKQVNTKLMPIQDMVIDTSVDNKETEQKGE